MRQGKKATRRLTVTFPAEDLERCETELRELRSRGIRTTMGKLIRTAVHEYITTTELSQHDKT